MTRIRRAAVLFLAAALLAVGATAAPAAAQAQPAPRPAHVLCTEFSAGMVNLSTATAAVWWQQHTTDCGYYIRVKIKCFSRFTGGVTLYGGFVEELYPTQSAQTCPSSHSSLQYVYQQVKFTATGALHTCERYPSDQCGSSRLASAHRR